TPACARQPTRGKTPVATVRRGEAGRSCGARGSVDGASGTAGGGMPCGDPIPTNPMEQVIFRASVRKSLSTRPLTWSGMSEISERYRAVADGFGARLDGVGPDVWST